MFQTFVVVEFAEALCGGLGSNSWSEVLHNCFMLFRSALYKVNLSTRNREMRPNTIINVSPSTRNLLIKGALVEVNCCDNGDYFNKECIDEG